MSVDDPMNDIWGPLMAIAEEQLKSHEQTMVFSGSSTLSEATYNKMMQSLIVKFKSGTGAYGYYNVPPGIAERLFGSETAGLSPGKFFIKEIKNVYPFKKIM